ncbi:MAG: metallophosphoesterase family protein [Bacteroidota bacterium]
MKTRTLVIGDIHGGLRALEQVLERATVTKEDRLIFLGDYVDGWSESCQVIEYLMVLEETHDCIFIRGNHDTWCEDWLTRAHVDEIWQRHGGAETIKSYGDYNYLKWDKHEKFFKAMKDYYIDEQNNLLIHAGYSSMHGPSKEVYASNYSWDRTLWEMALTMDKNIPEDSVLYPQRLKLFHKIFIGHTPTINYNEMEPMHAANVWNVDTGAGFSGKLSIMNADTNEFWQSDIVKTLYPNEKGRNKF